MNKNLRIEGARTGVSLLVVHFLKAYVDAENATMSNRITLTKKTYVKFALSTTHIVLRARNLAAASDQHTTLFLNC